MHPSELITILKAQHRALEVDLALALENLDAGTEGYLERIVQNLLKFRTDLSEHLKLEDDEFYPDYFRKNTGNETKITTGKEFLREMSIIGRSVHDFLDRYSTAESIGASISRFRIDLLGTMSTLKTRIETEEEGIYDFYLLLG